jgi:hypothetical protein
MSFVCRSRNPAPLNPSLPTKNTRHILIGKYAPEKPAERTRNCRFLKRNANFEHSSNKQQFPLFESHISPAFSKTNPEYFKRKMGSRYPVAGIVRLYVRFKGTQWIFVVIGGGVVNLRFSLLQHDASLGSSGFLSTES